MSNVTFLRMNLMSHMISVFNYGSWQWKLSMLNARTGRASSKRSSSPSCMLPRESSHATTFVGHFEDSGLIKNNWARKSLERWMADIWGAVRETFQEWLTVFTPAKVSYYAWHLNHHLYIYTGWSKGYCQGATRATGAAGFQPSKSIRQHRMAEASQCIYSLGCALWF